MNRLQRSVATKKEKRKLEEEKLKQEPKVDYVAEIIGILFGLFISIGVIKILFSIYNG